VWGTAEMCTEVCVGAELNKRESLEEQCVDVGMLKSIREKRWESVVWINMARCADRWRAPVNAVMKLRVS
jgi:hypothetical protein